MALLFGYALITALKFSRNFSFLDISIIATSIVLLILMKNSGLALAFFIATLTSVNYYCSNQHD